MAVPVENKKDDFVFYPAFCFKASPTHFSWVKMTATDMQRLVKIKGFEGQNTFFYNNHPIRFVTLVGLIVARTEAYRRTILTLDDSSGATVDIVVLRAENPVDAPTTAAATETAETAMAPSHLTATAKTPLDIASLVPGALVKVKGTLSTFRAVTQVQLERFFPVPNTKAEMQFLRDRVQYLVDILSVPWVLTDEEVEQLRLEADEEGREAEEARIRREQRARRRVEREEKDRRRIRKMYELEERAREKEARRCREAGRKLMLDIKWRSRREET